MFVPEELTSLAYCPIYQQLTLQQRLHYNQCYALYLNEQTAAFELVLIRFMQAVARLDWARPLRAEIFELVREEQLHARQFMEFNRRARPDLYSQSDRVFVRTALLFSGALKALLSLPKWLPFPLWIILLLEERSLHYSARWAQAEVEPQLIQLHRMHALDEDRHVALGDQLIHHLWASRPGWLRRTNARILTAVLREFFFFPKRAALEIVRVAFAGHPDCAEMQRQLLALRNHPGFLKTLYSRASNPLTLARLEAYPELAPLLEMLAG